MAGASGLPLVRYLLGLPIMHGYNKMILLLKHLYSHIFTIKMVKLYIYKMD